MKEIAILTADIHITNSQPPARKDDYKTALINKLRLIRNIAMEKGIPVLDAGDVFDKARPSPEVISMALENLPNPFITIAGNHDLAYHTNDLFNETALYSLTKANIGIKVLKPYETIVYGDMTITGFPYGFYDVSKIDESKLTGKINIALIHIMTYQGEKPYPQCKDKSASELAELFNKFDLVVSGHNHQCFTAKMGKTTLLNPGSLMRSNAVQCDYIPKIWYLMEDGSLEYEEIEVDSSVISREHLVDKEETNERIEAYVEILNKIDGVSFSFENNLDKYIKENNIEIEVENKIKEKMEG